MRFTAGCFKSLIFFLVFSLMVMPDMVSMAWAQQTSSTPILSTASTAQIQAVEQLAKDGYLGDEKSHYLSNESLDENDITNAILQARGEILAVDLKNSQAVQKFNILDLQALLTITRQRAADIRSRNISAWRLENHLQKMIAMESASPRAAAVVSSTPTAVLTWVPTAIPATPTPTPIPGPTLQEFNTLRSSFNTLNTQYASLSADFEKRGETVESLQNDEDSIKVSNAGNQEQLKLIKKLLDRMQNDLEQSQQHMNDVEQLVNQKMTEDTTMQQQVLVMNKDLQDNTEDISVLKEQIAELQLTTAPSQSPIDNFLGSKWLPGGALLVGLVALTVSLVRK